MTPVTSSSLVPTSTSNESHTRSDELRARSKFTHLPFLDVRLRVGSHARAKGFSRSGTACDFSVTANELHTRPKNRVCRHEQLSRDFASRPTNEFHNSFKDSQLSVAITRGTSYQIVANKDWTRIQQRSATMFAVYLLCVPRAKYDLFCLTQMGCAMNHQCAMLKNKCTAKV